jgi:hypothetical protein
MRSLAARRPREAVALAVAVAAGVACASRSSGSGPSRTPSPPPAEDLVGEGARPVIVRSADLDGDGVAEVAIAAVSAAVDELGLAAPSLQVFDVRDGRWVTVFDATAGAPPGAGAPPDMLAPVDQGFVSQSVDTLEVVDFARDGRPELVAGILNFGATAGPLELWVVSLETDGSASAEFYEASARDGSVEVRDDRLRFEFGVYRDDDPGCCPSRIAVQTIGWDPESSRVEVLDEDRSPVPGG